MNVYRIDYSGFTYVAAESAAKARGYARNNQVADSTLCSSSIEANIVNDIDFIDDSWEHDNIPYNTDLSLKELLDPKDVFAEVLENIPMDLRQRFKDYINSKL